MHEVLDESGVSELMISTCAAADFRTRQQLSCSDCLASSLVKEARRRTS